MRGTDILERLLDPVFAKMIEVGRQIDRDRTIGCFFDVEDMEVRAHLINNTAIGERGIF